MASMFKCDRCNEIKEGYPSSVELPSRAFLERSKAKDLCQTCLAAFKTLVWNFMEKR